MTEVMQMPKDIKYDINEHTDYKHFISIKNINENLISLILKNSVVDQTAGRNLQSKAVISDQLSISEDSFMVTKNNKQESTITSIQTPAPAILCRECNDINSQTKLIHPRTKQSGYYCDKCIQNISKMDEIWKRDLSQFYAMYPEHSDEHNKTF